MNIPTPAAVKKLTEDRKAREAELASSLANAKDKMPPTKGAHKPSSSVSSKRETDTVSAPSVSSRKGTGSPDRSSSTPRRSSKSSQEQRSAGTKSRSNRGSGGKVRTGTSTGSRNSTSSTREITKSSADIRKGRSSTSMTTRRNSSKRSNETGTKSAPEAKKPFERPDHLTQRPLRGNEALLNLRKQLEKPARGQFKREYRVGGRRSGKSQGLQNKKENN